MNITTVLFDLDGTLLPMDMDVFIKAYFGALAKRLAPHGYAPEALIDAVWKGTKEMVKNDGSMTNEQVFWKKFCEIYGEDAAKDEPLFDEFYRTDFAKVQSVCGFNEKTAQLIRLVKEKGLRVALATNPIFPAIATESRIRWAGLEPQDFELYTTYENSRYSKPNPDYFREVLSKLGVQAGECLMVGNDVSDDMPAKELGMRVFLLTDCLINAKNADISAYPHGDMDALMAYIRAL